jgi:hypothetical protein
MYATSNVIKIYSVVLEMRWTDRYYLAILHSFHALRTKSAYKAVGDMLCSKQCARLSLKIQLRNLLFATDWMVILCADFIPQKTGLFTRRG